MEGFCQLKNPPYINPTGNEFPIVASSTFREEADITLKNFEILKEGGFNVSLALLPNIDLTIKSLKYAKQVGIYVMANCPQTRTVSSIAKNIPRIKGYSSLMGYYLGDEPSAQKFKEIKKLRDEIYKYDTQHALYLNLLPIADPKMLGTRTYKIYIQEFFKIIDLPFVSYDHYPIIKNNGKISVKDTFYENLEIVSSVCKEYDRQFWAFCLSSPHFSYPEPTLGHLTFEAFSALAYGAQGLSYYTYMGEKKSSINFAKYPVNTRGERTNIWYLCKDVNGQIQAQKDVFLGAKLVNAWHTGRTIPKGCKKLGALPGPFETLKTGNSGVLVSHLKNGDKNYLVIVSHDVEKNQDIDITYKNSTQVKQVLPNGKVTESIMNSYTLTPGGYLVFQF